MSSICHAMQTYTFIWPTMIADLKRLKTVNHTYWPHCCKSHIILHRLHSGHYIISHICNAVTGWTFLLCTLIHRALIYCSDRHYVSSFTFIPYSTKIGTSILLQRFNVKLSNSQNWNMTLQQFYQTAMHHIPLSFAFASIFSIFMFLLQL